MKLPFSPRRNTSNRLPAQEKRMLVQFALDRHVYQPLPHIMEHGPEPEPVIPPEPVVVPEPVKVKAAPPTTMGAPVGQSVIRTVIKTVGMLCLLASAAFAQNVGAPWAGAPAKMFPFQGAPFATTVTDPPANAVPGSPNDQVAQIQEAMDKGGVVQLPPGTYNVCLLFVRQPNVILRGAGKGATILKSTQGCVNMIVPQTTSGPRQSTGGPAYSFAIENLTLKGNGTQTLVNMTGRDVIRFRASNIGVDLASPGDTGDTQGIIIAGVNDVLIENSEFYSSVPGHGKAISIISGAQKPIVRNNTCKWTYNCFEWGTAGVDGARFESNTINMGWAHLPTKFSGLGNGGCLQAGVPAACCTGSGTGTCGTNVTYTDGVLTDSGAAFTGLCDDGGSPGACANNLGNQVRVMTPIVVASASVNFNTGGNIITDSGKNFNSAGVKEGDIVRTLPVCRGNGLYPPSQRGICSSTTGTGTEGDRCVCAGNSDCASGICEARFAAVIQVNSNTTLQVDEWVSDIDRRPTGPPVGATAGIYTVYSWVYCTTGTWTATSINCSATTVNHFKKWDLGTVVTPAAGAYYEVMTRHPNYPFIEAAAASNSVITGNNINWGFSDNIFTTGLNPVVTNNRITNGQDHCTNIQGANGIIMGNHARQCGVRAIANFSPNSVMSDNVGMNTPISAVGSSSCPVVIGNSISASVVATNNKAINSVTLANSTSGICVQNTASDVKLINNSCSGTFGSVGVGGCYRIDTPSNLNIHIQGYHGEVISKMSAAECTANGIPQACCTALSTGATCGNGTYSIEGGLTTFALGPNVNAAQNGSYHGCSDCTVASPCAGGGTGAVAKRQGAAWVCN